MMMNNRLLTSERLFEVWRYTPSHRQLLLRSNKSEGLNTRIEILFKDISVVMVVPVFSGLIISECEIKEYPVGFAHSIGDRSLYKVESAEFIGYIVAGSVSIHEDELGYDEPSALLPSFTL